MMTLPVKWDNLDRAHIYQNADQEKAPWVTYCGMMVAKWSTPPGDDWFLERGECAVCAEIFYQQHGKAFQFHYRRRARGKYLIGYMDG